MTIVRRNSAFGGPFLVMGAIVLSLYFARGILIPLAFALTLNFLIYPIVNQIQRLHVGRVPAVLIVIVGFLGGAGCLGWIVAKQLVAVADNLPDYRMNIHSKMAMLHFPDGGPIGQAITSVSEVSSDLSGPPFANSPHSLSTNDRLAGHSRTRRSREREVAPTEVEIVPAPVGVLQYLRDVLTPLVQPLGVALIVLVFTIFMVIEREDLRNRVLLLAGVSRINLMTQALEDASTRVSRYLVMQFVVNAGYGVLFGFGLHLLRLPNATLWGVLIGILRLIPYVGALTAATFPFLLSIAVFESWWPTIAVFLLFASLEIIVANFVEPWLYGNRTGISSLALLVSAIFWTLIWGWPGLMLSTPLTVCVIVLGRHVPQMSFLQILLGHEAELSPGASLYQRLLATDQRGARTIVERFLKDHQLVELYDEVFIPCLGFAEEDRHKGALDEARETFLYSTLTEFIAEFGEYTADHPLLSEENAKDEINLNAIRKPAAVIMAAEDRADEVTGAMLAQVLEQAQYKTVLLPPSYQSEELLQLLGTDETSRVCISALPPFAFARARTLCQKLRERLPSTSIFLGMWGSTEEIDRLRARFGQIDPDNICTTIAGMTAQIDRSGKGILESRPVEVSGIE